MENPRVILLDTSAVVRLYLKGTSAFSANTLRLMEDHDLRVSPMVCLELSYLEEIGRLQDSADGLFRYLNKKVGLEVLELPMMEYHEETVSLQWTRDPFDRLIVAQAEYFECNLVTSDRLIQKNYPKSIC